MQYEPKSLIFNMETEFILMENNNLQKNRNISVKRLPFRSNGFYFTHNFWIDKNTLIINSCTEYTQQGIYKVQKNSIFFQCKFIDDYNRVLITRITTPEINPVQCVLSHSKKFLIVVDSNNILHILDIKNFEEINQIRLNIPNNFVLGQLSLTSDDNFLLYDLNLDWNKPELSNSKISSKILMKDIETLKEIVIHQVNMPFILNHVLPNPFNKNQISFAMTKHKKNEFGRTEECNQRLWVADIKSKSEIAMRPIYNQLKNKFFKKYEIVTHECWCANGKHLTFIVRRDKIKCINVITENSQIIMDKGPNPWHCDGSDENWITFDTLNKDTGIWISKKDNTNLLNLAGQKADNNSQNAHPHPFFSPDLSHVIYNSCVKGIEYLHVVKTNIRN